MLRRSAYVVAALMVVACARKPATTTVQDTLTRRQKDSAIGASAIPGAQGVRKAMDAADSAAARNAVIDSTGAAIP
ncbi:MAG TPA: hypothetical protein VGP80_00180 [Gemmatimonadales bacterium]|jgi:hypothetical protein|nr:hypothetical protein [Gemmatimonadales bacterium]